MAVSKGAVVPEAFRVMTSGAPLAGRVAIVSGKRLLEKHMARSKGAAYADYVRRTSGFVPWPPR